MWCCRCLATCLLKSLLYAKAVCGSSHPHDLLAVGASRAQHKLQFVIWHCTMLGI